MQYLVEKIEMVDNKIYLVDPGRSKPVKIEELSATGDLFISVAGESFIVVDSKLFLGALKAMTSLNERDRINSKRRCSTCTN